MHKYIFVVKVSKKNDSEGEVSLAKAPGQKQLRWGTPVLGKSSTQW